MSYKHDDSDWNGASCEYVQRDFQRVNVDGGSNNRNWGNQNRNRSNFDNRGPRTVNNSQWQQSNRRSDGGSWDNQGSSFNKRRPNRPNASSGNDSFSHSGASGSDTRDNATTIDVPSHAVSRIIGRAGSRINSIRESTQTQISVGNNSNEATTTIKIFSRPGSDVQRAVDMINDIVKECETGSGSNSNTHHSQRRQVVEEEPSFDAVQETKVEEQTTETKPAPIVDWQAFLKESEDRNKQGFDSKFIIVKNFYKEHPEVTRMTESEVEDFRMENMNIVVERTFKTESSKPIPKPCITFEHAFHEYPDILSELKRVGFDKPTPIQSQAWPVLLSGEDMIGIAQTGTGKTIAFLLPALVHIVGQTTPRSERKGPTVMIMAPTRELALQIEKEVVKYNFRGVKAVCLYGGGDRKKQIQTVEDGVDIVIATPGRLNDIWNAGKIDINWVTFVVLDEADRMLDMGFEPQIRRIMYSINPSRQAVMTSATWPMGIRRLAQSYMVDPIQIYVGSLDLAATHTVTQKIWILDDEANKLPMLIDFLTNMTDDQKVIVFCGKKAMADDISSDLALMRIPCQTLHGARDQIDREQALEDIISGAVQVLIATDLASRGLDIDDITHVINYDFPHNIEEYVHRVGRTGRAGKSGESISFFTKRDKYQAKELIKILEEANQEIPQDLYHFAELAEKYEDRRGSSGGRFRGGRGGGRKRW